MSDPLEALHVRATSAGYEAAVHEHETDDGPVRRLSFWIASEDEDAPSRVLVSPETAQFVMDSTFDDFLLSTTWKQFGRQQLGLLNADSIPDKRMQRLSTLWK
jgi:hypothetical protein